MQANKRADRVSIDGIELVLTAPDDHEAEWLDFDDCVLRCRV